MIDSSNSHHLAAILFDWAGTTVDYGSRAPAAVFLEIFKRRGVEVTVAEAREPMGRAKRDHIATVLAMPRVRDLWQKVHGRPPADSDVDQMYREFLPLQKSTLAKHCDIIPGVIEVVAECRKRGLKIGASTGYTRELMDVVYPIVASGGYSPDVSICADDVPAGRPAPWMNFRAAERLGVYPMSSIVTVDDTPIGIAGGKNAGCWTVAVTRTGNSVGLSESELAALSKDEQARRLGQARESFQSSGAHYVIDGVAELLPVLEQIERRLASGERP